MSERRNFEYDIGLGLMITVFIVCMTAGFMMDAYVGHCDGCPLNTEHTNGED